MWWGGLPAPGYAANNRQAFERKARKFKDSERLFSLSSCTAPQPQKSDRDMDDDALALRGMQPPTQAKL